MRLQAIWRKLADNLFITLLALLFVGIEVRVAHAYLDPGTGSILLQSTLALIAGAAVTLRLYWSRLKALIWRRKVEADPRAGRDA